MLESALDPGFVLVGKILLASALGLLLGAERAFIARSAAGLRTFALVSLGSCLFVLTGLAVDGQFLGRVNFDPTRVLAAVVQGIGFLGAGLIIFKNDNLHGVTTAAGLWVAAAIGAMVGFGLYGAASFATFLALVLFFAMWYVEQYFKQRFPDIRGFNQSQQEE